MKKISPLLLCVLFVALFISTNAQVNNLPSNKTVSHSKIEISRGMEEKSNEINPINIKEKSTQKINAKRGVKAASMQAVRMAEVYASPAVMNMPSLPKASFKNQSQVCDTFVNYTSNDSLAVYTYTYNQGTKTKFGGYVSGTNHYKDKAKAEFFNVNSPGAEVTTAYLLFGKATYATSSSTVNIVVWDNTGTNGSPGSVLGSQSVKISDIASDVTNGYFTDVTFTTPVTVNTPFYVGVQLSSTAGDTVAIYTTTQYNQNANTAFEQWSDNSWASYDTSWGVNLNHFDAVALCVNSSVSAE
jgi:hypothetical protein